MRKLGEQWVEEFDGKKHMLKVVEQAKTINADVCGGCYFGVCGDICHDGALHVCGYGEGKCPLDNVDWVIKDLGVLNEDGLLPCPFCGEYPSLIKPEYGYQRLERQSRNGYAYECGCGVICGWDYDYGGTHQTEQEAIDAWNRRA